MKRSLKFTILFSFLLSLNFQSQAQTACNHDGSRQLDFMIGDWDFFAKNGELLGENKIQLVLGTCTLEEAYESTDGFKTRSVMSFDENTKIWSNIWTDDFGTTLHFSGKFQDNKLLMKATSINAQGKKTYHRLTYSQNANGTISHIWQKSTNQKDWETIFNGTYKRQKAVL
jgi:hypothetical protein